MKFIVGTTNPAKLSCVMAVVNQVFPVAGSPGPVNHESWTLNEVRGVNVESGVSYQPFSVEETRAGAANRAKAAMAIEPDCDYAVGLEGGVEVIGDQYFECGWICVIHRESGRVGWGSSARFELSKKIVSQLRAGKELAEVMSALSGVENVGRREGAMGILTDGNLTRTAAYAHGVIFAFAPFLSDVNKYWDQ
jgi:inosine/xanthosine triphosphatase